MGRDERNLMEMQVTQARDCCCTCIGLVVFIVSLCSFLLASAPTLSIESFTLPALNSTNSSLATAPGSGNITFLLKLNNPNRMKGIHYQDVNLAFFHLPNQSSVTLVGNYTVPKFYQGHKKSAKKKGTLETYHNNNTKGVEYWVEVIASNHTPTTFRVDVATRVSFTSTWGTKRTKGVRVSGVVEVDETGNRVKAKKGVKLKSGAAPLPHLRMVSLRLLLFVICFVLWTT